MLTYKLQAFLPPQTEYNVVLRSDGLSIPFSPDNTDYQAYLAWLDAGNTPLPADEGVA
jgi:hypothetical protein